MANNNKTEQAASGKTIYLTNKELLAEVVVSKNKGAMTDRLARMLLLLCNRYAKKGNFVGYSYNEDMQGYAMMMLVRTWNAFDPKRSNNPFAFFTQCIKNSFIQYLKQEKRQRQLKDELLLDMGLNPSSGYEDEQDKGEPGEVVIQIQEEQPEQPEVKPTRARKTPLKDKSREEVLAHKAEWKRKWYHERKQRRNSKVGGTTDGDQAG